MAGHCGAIPLVNPGKSIPHLQTRKRERAGVKRRPVCLASHCGASGFIDLVENLLDHLANPPVPPSVLAVGVSDMREKTRPTGATCNHQQCTPPLLDMPSCESPEEDACNASTNTSRKKHIGQKQCPVAHVGEAERAVHDERPETKDPDQKPDPEKRPFDTVVIGNWFDPVDEQLSHPPALIIAEQRLHVCCRR